MGHARWVFTSNYTAYRDGVKLGPWVEGDVVEFEHEVAAWIYRDCPGILKSEADVKAEEKAEEEARARKAAPQNRQAKTPRNRGS